MKRMASMFTGLSIAVLFFVASAQAQFDGQKISVNIPFEFNIGATSLPAGQYEFARTNGGIFTVRNAGGHSMYTGVTAPTQANSLPEKSMLKFAVVNGKHVLIQIWNEQDAVGNEFQYGNTYVRVAKQASIHGIAAGRR